MTLPPSSPFPSPTAPSVESADSCDSLVLIRLNRDVTSPSFRFDSRADVSLTHRTGRVGREEERGNEGTNHHRHVRPRDRRDGGCPRERADSSRDRASARLLEMKRDENEIIGEPTLSDIDGIAQTGQNVMESSSSYSQRGKLNSHFHSGISIFRVFQFVERVGMILNYILQQGFKKCQICVSYALKIELRK